MILGPNLKQVLSQKDNILVNILNSVERKKNVVLPKVEL